MARLTITVAAVLACSMVVAVAGVFLDEEALVELAEREGYRVAAQHIQLQRARREITYDGEKMCPCRREGPGSSEENMPSPPPSSSEDEIPPPPPPPPGSSEEYMPPQPSGSSQEEPGRPSPGMRRPFPPPPPGCPPPPPFGPHMHPRFRMETTSDIPCEPHIGVVKTSFMAIIPSSGSVMSYLDHKGNKRNTPKNYNGPPCELRPLFKGPEKFNFTAKHSCFDKWQMPMAKELGLSPSDLHDMSKYKPVRGLSLMWSKGCDMQCYFSEIDLLLEDEESGRVRINEDAVDELLKESDDSAEMETAINKVMNKCVKTIVGLVHPKQVCTSGADEFLFCVQHGLNEICPGAKWRGQHTCEEVESVRSKLWTCHHIRMMMHPHPPPPPHRGGPGGPWGWRPHGPHHGPHHHHEFVPAVDAAESTPAPAAVADAAESAVQPAQESEN